jgi:hypothetical protein
MAEITKTLVAGSVPVVVSVLVLGASDTLVFKKGVNATLILNNVTAGPLTPTITGASAVTFPAEGLGNIVTSGGFVYPAAIAAGETRAIKLDNIKGWLEGVITITDGALIEAQLLEDS